MVERTCKQCQKKFCIKPSILLKKGGGKFCSSYCHYSSRKNGVSPLKGRKFPELSGENSPAWKGDNVGYAAKHDWIKLKRGLAKFHECSKKDNTCKGILHWSNISGKYLRELSDWWVLCQSHHVKFDMTDEWRKKIGIANSVSQIGRKHTEETKKKISLIHIGKKFSEKHRKNLSIAAKLRWSLLNHV